MPSQYYAHTVNIGNQCSQDILEQNLQKVTLDRLVATAPENYNQYNSRQERVYSKAQKVLLKYDSESNSFDYKTPLFNGKVARNPNVILPNEEQGQANNNSNVSNDPNAQSQAKTSSFAKNLVKNSLFKTPERKVGDRYFTNVNFRVDSVNELDENGQQSNIDHSDPSQMYQL